MCALSAKEDDLCIVCETIVQYVEAMLDDKTSVDEIEKLLKKICNFLPGSMTAQVRLVTNTLCIVFSILTNSRLFVYCLWSRCSFDVRLILWICGFFLCGPPDVAIN